MAAHFPSRFESPASQDPRYRLKELADDSPLEVVAEARELLLEYGRFVAAQPGIASFCYGALEVEAAELPRRYLESGGGALVGYVTGRPLGFVAWRGLAAPEWATVWEVKRLWVRPEARGMGLGRGLVQAVVDRATAAGKTYLLLDTAPEAMAAAHRLYLEMGFVACPPYSGSSNEGASGIVYLRKDLGKEPGRELGR